MHLPVLAKAELALEIAPALLAVGYILGYKQSAIMVSGSLISAIVLTPLIATFGAGLTAPMFPEMKLSIAAMTAAQIWSRYVRYIGAGAVAAAGIVAVIKALPTMASSFAAVMRGLRRGGVSMTDGENAPRTDRDVPSWIVVVVPLAVVITLVGVPGLLAGNMAFGPRLVAALGVAIFGVCFVVVSSRIVGLIGVSSNPTSAMTLVTLLGASVVFVLLRLDRSLRARGDPHRRHRRLHRRIESGRHLAGFEDRIPRRRHARANSSSANSSAPPAPAGPSPERCSSSAAPSRSDRPSSPRRRRR